MKKIKFFPTQMGNTNYQPALRPPFDRKAQEAKSGLAQQSKDLGVDQGAVGGASPDAANRVFMRVF